MDPSTLPRIGIVRPDGATADRVVADAEARVVRHEFERRLGPTGFDLRTRGKATGPWLPHAHAAWPVDIDLELVADDLWEDDQTALTALFGRTVAGQAAEVRERMLIHLGVIPSEPAPLDEQRLAALRALHLRPTDLWLVVRHACELQIDDPAIRAFAEPTGSPSCRQLDNLFDRLAVEIASELPGDEAGAGSRIPRLTAERDDLRRQVAALEHDLVRVTAEADETVVQLQAELRVLSERLDRAELDRALASGFDDTP